MNVEVLLLFTKQLSHYLEEWLHSANALDHQPIKEQNWDGGRSLATSSAAQ